MAATVIKPDHLGMLLHISLKCSRFIKIFRKDGLIHPPFRPRPVSDSWNSVL
jgi:hypothetical protein